MKVYITKYALTAGIICLEGREGSSPGMIVVRRDGAMFDEYFHGNDWHTDLDEAKIKAEQMRYKKIRSLQKNLEKMEKLKIEVVQ